MAEFPAMPLFCEPLLADTDHLTESEFGLYMRMLAKLWLAPNNRFPNDDAWLGRKFRKTAEEVATQVRPLLAEFFKTDGNWLHHKRIDKEFAYVERKSKKQSDRAKSRWKKEKAECRGNANGGNAPTHTPTSPPTPVVENQTTVPTTVGTAAPPERAKAALWREMKAQVGGSNPGSLIGKWVRDYGIGAVSEAHYAAMGSPPVDYVEWMAGRLKANGKPYPARMAHTGNRRRGDPIEALHENLARMEQEDDDNSQGGLEAISGVSFSPAFVMPGSRFVS